MSLRKMQGAPAERADLSSGYYFNESEDDWKNDAEQIRSNPVVYIKNAKKLASGNKENKNGEENYVWGRPFISE